MGLSMSPTVWQQFMHKVFINLLNRERYKIIMDDVMVLSRKDQHFEDLTNLF